MSTNGPYKDNTMNTTYIMQPGVLHTEAKLANNSNILTDHNRLISISIKVFIDVSVEKFCKKIKL